MERYRGDKLLNISSAYRKLNLKPPSRSRTIQLYRLVRRTNKLVDRAPEAVDLREDIVGTISAGFEEQRQELITKTKDRMFDDKEANQYAQFVFEVRAAGKYQSLGPLEKEARAVIRQARKTLRKIVSIG